ncbi:MAG TPA: deoxyguanosinetriphosphate triphosphohydrolase [Dermatophilaceae bacterium]|nr:deoxyguanosinetriphosphate triphosphohydrolase [Dermatophilaceae bacterium]
MDRYRPSDRCRWVPEDPARKRADRDDFARDRARVVHSAALRRLAAKTQVVQPDTDDFVRNRLTHSLEVAQIGREFGAVLGCDGDVVDTACLAHDLGHPPFGHNGEVALNEVADGIGGFEGNAQTLRLLTRLEAKRAHPDGTPAGLNLTRASLDATVKYPWPRGEAPAGTRGGKFGVYPDDRPVFDWIRADLAPGGRRRCLEAQVMDWSDDVAYSVHDVEDAVAGGLLDLRVLRSDLDMQPVYRLARDWYVPHLDEAELAGATHRLLASGLVPADFDGSRPALAALKDMTSQLIGGFVRTAEEATRQRYGPDPLTRHGADLVVPAASRAECAVLKALAAHFVMTTPYRLQVMRRERRVVADLVRVFADRPAQRLDPPLRHDYESASDDASRLRVVVDQVACLSDARALVMHRRWCGSDG